MSLPVIYTSEIIDKIEYIKSRNQFNTEGLSQWIDYLEWIVRYISNKSIAWDYAGQFKSDRYGNVYFNSLGYNLVFNFEKDKETTQLYVVIVDMDLNIDEFGLNESKTNKNVIRLTESDLKIMIQECIKNILYESYSIRRLGRFDVVKGDNQPHSIKGLEQYGNTLYDVRLYSEANDKKKTFAIFSIGKNTSKYICCRLESDDEYGTWLGFTPIKNYDVPTMIKQDLKTTL